MSVSLINISVTGSMSAGSNVLTLPSSAGFVQGQYVIVEIGAEPGLGARGSWGVGGAWPPTYYATGGAMLADTSRPTGTYAWTLDNGYVYIWNGATWVELTFYYISRAIPLALEAQILAVSGDGLQLTLDKTAVVPVTGANVYLNNRPIINTAILLNPSLDDELIELPAGVFAGSGAVDITARNGLILGGQGQAQTTLWTPRGAGGLRVDIHDLGFSTRVNHLTLKGNQGLDGFGAPPMNGVAIAPNWGCGIIMRRGSNDCLVEHVTVVDAMQQSICSSESHYCWAKNCTVRLIHPLMEYTQWFGQWADAGYGDPDTVEANGGGMEDCTFDSDWLVYGPEITFKSKNTVMRRITGRNVYGACNSGGSWLWDDCEFTFNEGCHHPYQPAWMPSQPVLNVTGNTDPNHPYLALGGNINNVRMYQEGYINANNDSLVGIVSQTVCPNVHVEGGLYYAPDYAEPSTRYGALAISLNGANNSVNNFTAKGKQKPGYDRVIVTQGTATNITYLENDGSSPPPPPPPPTTLTLSVSPSSLAPGATLTVYWANIPTPNQFDWIGIFAPAATTWNERLGWVYLSGTQYIPATALASGSCSFAIPNDLASGPYRVRLFFNNGIVVQATSGDFTVVVASVDCAVSAWGAWTPVTAPGACINSLQYYDEIRTRTVVTQPSGGGAACGPLSETRTQSQACVVEEPGVVNCVLSAWSAWGPTSEWGPWVDNVRTRTEGRVRTVITQPSGGGLACGPLTEERVFEQVGSFTLPAVAKLQEHLTELLTGETARATIELIDMGGITLRFSQATLGTITIQPESLTFSMTIEPE